MKPSELIEKLNNGALDKYSALYADISATKLRIIEAINAFTAKFGSDRDIAVFSTPGRSEIIGNHTDHNCGLSTDDMHGAQSEGLKNAV